MRVVAGDAFKEIPKLQGTFDVVFLDAWKPDYKKFFDLVFPRVTNGGLFLAHNFTGSDALLGAWFLDPSNGKRRRHLTRDRVLAFFRGGGRSTARLGRNVSAHGYGVVRKATHLREERKDFDDATLKAKVETVLFADQSFPKGRVNVNVENGRVVLRGELEHPDDITAAETRVRRVNGVRDVENLLHLPGTPAPH